MKHLSAFRVLLGIGIFAGANCTDQQASAAAVGEGAGNQGDQPTASTSVVVGSDAKPSPLSKDARTDSHVRALRGNTLDGATGQLRLVSADSGDVGSFRVSLSESLFSGKGVLCPNCMSADGTVSAHEDSVGLSSTRVQLSLTPVRFLEAFGSVQFRSTSNDQSTPKVIQTAGNADLGVKLFVPYRSGRIWNVGALTDLSIMAMSKSVGSATVSADIGGLGTLDFRELSNANKLPIRLHFNAIYRIDNSWKSAESIESNRSDLVGHFQRVTRIDRLGFEIRRTDMLRVGLGAEAPFERYRPFAEWSIDVPVNRQGHVCRTSYLSPGDDCLARNRDFSAIPSRMSLGIRAFPFTSLTLESIGLLAAVDIGTGGTSTFIEEVIPEIPWMAHVGLSYAFDVNPRVERVVEVQEKKVVMTPPLPPETFVVGRIVEKLADGSNGQPIAQALVFFKDSNKPGIIADNDGRFRTVELTPGEYAFRVTKDGFSDAECTATVVAPNPPKEAKSLGDKVAREQQPTDMTCSLVRLPTTATVLGTLRDSETTLFIPRAVITVSDDRGRKVSLQTDEFGGFRFENVPSGTVHVQVEAEGYLASATDLQVKPREDATVPLTVHKRPKQLNVTVTAKEVKLKRQIHFLHDSAEVQPDSLSLLEELADVMRTHPEITRIEIQGHTDDTGSAEHNLTLSRDRANAVRAALIVLGVAPDRLEAKGYGPTKPLVPNTNNANRTKNRRVQLMIQGL